MLMTPHLSSGTNSSSSFINYKWDIVFLSDYSESLIIVRSSEMVIVWGDWFNNNSSNILFAVSSLLNNISDCLKASILFIFVFLTELSDWVFNLWKWSSWPVEGWNWLNIGLWVTAWKSGDWGSVEAIVKTKNTEVWSISNFVIFSVLENSNSKSRFISSCCCSITQVNLIHSIGGYWHHVLSEKISIVIWWKNWGINCVSYKSVIDISCSSLQQS